MALEGTIRDFGLPDIFQLLSFTKKTGALQHVLTGPPDPNTYPAAGLRSTEGTLIWWVDREAAGQPTLVATPRHGDADERGSDRG